MTLYEYLLKYRHQEVLKKFKIKPEDVEEHIRVYELFYTTDGDASVEDIIRLIQRPKASIYRIVRKLNIELP